MGGGFTNQLDQTRPYSTREYLHLLGRELAEMLPGRRADLSLTKARVPFLSAIATRHPIGIAAARLRRRIIFTSTSSDVLDMMQVSVRARTTE